MVSPTRGAPPRDLAPTKQSPVQSLASFRRLREINETEAVLIVLVNSCGPAILTVKQIRVDYETQTGTTLHKEAIFN